MFAGGGSRRASPRRPHRRSRRRAGLTRARARARALPDRRGNGSRRRRIRSPARSSRRCWRCIARGTSRRRGARASASCATRAPVTPSGLHTRERRTRASSSGSTLPVCRVIVNQAHCFATGGSFDNALPFSLSMGCGSWGGNSISDNLNYRHFLNITRVVRPLSPDRGREPTDARALRSLPPQVRRLRRSTSVARRLRTLRDVIDASRRDATRRAVPARARTGRSADLSRARASDARALERFSRARASLPARWSRSCCPTACPPRRFFWARCTAGYVVSPLNLLAQDAHLAHTLAHSGTRFVFAAPEFVERINRLLERARAAGRGARDRSRRARPGRGRRRTTAQVARHSTRARPRC